MGATRLRPIDHLLQGVALRDPKLYEALRELSGSVFDLGNPKDVPYDMTVPGPLATGDDLAKPLLFLAGDQIVEAVANLDVAPSGAAVAFEITIVGTGIVDGSVIGSGGSVSPKFLVSKVIPGAGIYRAKLNITSVGSTNPGEDLVISFKVRR